MKHGYKIEVLRGFLFEKDYIFSGYVDSLYKIKENSNRDSPEFLISKMLLNSIYGRFGMSIKWYKFSNRLIDSNNLR